jgi:hypothetical protein
MKYKVGDKVIIKTWKVMEEEFGLNISGNIKCHLGYISSMEKEINRLNINRIVTIKQIVFSR